MKTVTSFALCSLALYVGVQAGGPVDPNAPRPCDGCVQPVVDPILTTCGKAGGCGKPDPLDGPSTTIGPPILTEHKPSEKPKTGPDGQPLPNKQDAICKGTAEACAQSSKDKEPPTGSDAPADQNLHPGDSNGGGKCSGAPGVCDGKPKPQPVSPMPFRFHAAAKLKRRDDAGSNAATAPGKSYTGDFTHWEPSQGACGTTNTADEPVVALSKVLFDPMTPGGNPAIEPPGGNPNKNPLCGKSVVITGKDGQKTTAKVVDRCKKCAEGDLDLTKSLFDHVTGNGDGRVGGMSWAWE